MKLSKICRACLEEKVALKPVFGAQVADMLMACASIQVMENDGLPSQICTQCLHMVSRAFSFKQLCQKSDATLRQYLNSINFHTVQLQNDSILISESKNTQLFASAEVLPQSSLFVDIFDDAQTRSLVENFTTQNTSAVVGDLADTMQSLQTIADQCLPASWEAEANLVDQGTSTELTHSRLCFQIFKCQFCEEAFKDEWTLAEHIKAHAGQAKYFCSLCGKGCATPLSLEKHLNLHSLDSTEKSEESKKLKCVMCNVCGEELSDSKLLKRHCKDKHTEGIINSNKIYVCAVCGKRYRQNKLLVIHMRTHTGERPLNCEVCGKSFSLPSSLYKHRLIHKGEKKHKCTVCGKGFTHASNVATHIRTHSGEKPFVCSTCGKCFTTNINLSIHTRIHTGEKPFKCSRCSDIFTTGSQLKKHTMCHTGEKPYKCWHCGKAFRQKDTCDTHIRYHTGERPYSCHLCSKRYIAASHLRVHIKGHTGEKKYHCSVCPRKFVEARSLSRHVMTHTGRKT